MRTRMRMHKVLYPTVHEYMILFGRRGKRWALREERRGGFTARGTEAEVEERKAEETLRREAAAAAVWIALGKGGKGHTWIAK